MIQRQREQWQLDEGSAEAYERYLVPLLFAPGADYMIELATPGPGERVLDVACGTGIVARRAAPRVGSGGKVVGLDLNEAMLGMASKMSSGVRPEIEWRQGDATSMPLPDGAFDVVLCQQGLQFFPDRPAAVSEMHRVLRPNGRLALSVLRSVEHNPGYRLLADALERHVGPEAGAMMRSPFPSLSGDEPARSHYGCGIARCQDLPWHRTRTLPDSGGVLAVGSGQLATSSADRSVEGRRSCGPDSRPW